MSDADRLADLVKHAPHSFRAIRAQGALQLTDAQFAALVRDNPGRFKQVRFAKRDGAGGRVLPGRPGVMLVAPLPA